MAVLSVAEFPGLGHGEDGELQQAPRIDENTTIQNATFNTSVAISNAIGNDTKLIRVVVDTNAFVKIAAAPTATTSHMYMAAGIPEYFTVKMASGLKVAAVAQ